MGPAAAATPGRMQSRAMGDTNMSNQLYHLSINGFQCWHENWEGARETLAQTCGACRCGSTAALTPAGPRSTQVDAVDLDSRRHVLVERDSAGGCCPLQIVVHASFSDLRCGADDPFPLTPPRRCRRRLRHGICQVGPTGRCARSSEGHVMCSVLIDHIVRRAVRLVARRGLHGVGQARARLEGGLS